MANAKTDTFQSTPSGGKATVGVLRRSGMLTVSIHAFRGEGDSCNEQACESLVSFNPRLPGGRRPALHALDAMAVTVSIHAFRGEGDRNI